MNINEHCPEIIQLLPLFIMVSMLIMYLCLLGRVLAPKTDINNNPVVAVPAAFLLATALSYYGCIALAFAINQGFVNGDSNLGRVVGDSILGTIFALITNKAPLLAGVTSVILLLLDTISGGVARRDIFRLAMVFGILAGACHYFLYMSHFCH